MNISNSSNAIFSTADDKTIW